MAAATFVLSALLPATGRAEAAATRVAWKLTSLTPGQRVKAASLVSVGSRGRQSWKVSGACVLRKGVITAKSTGVCTVRLQVAKWGRFRAASSVRRLTIRPVTTGTTPQLPDYVPFVPPGDPAGSVARSTTVRFDFTGAVGLVSARTSPVSTSAVTRSSAASNLNALLTDGTLRDALGLGSASVADFYVAPNNRVYVRFSGPTDLGGVSCALAQVYRDTGEVVCLETSAESVWWPDDEFAVQFDSSGNIYWAVSRGGGETVLRRYSAGAAADHMSLQRGATKFLVMRNGNVIVAGSTSFTGQPSLQWARFVTPAGRVTTVASESVGFIRYFPDGEAYLAANTEFKRVSPTGDVVSWNPGTGAVGFGGSNIEWFYTAKSEVYVDVPGVTFQRLYPTYKRDFVSIARTTTAVAVGSSVVLAGITSGGTHRMVRFDPLAGKETVLAGEADEIEFQNVRWSASTGRIYFDGLRFRDNTHVVGHVDPVSLALNATPSTLQVDAFQMFPS